MGYQWDCISILSYYFYKEGIIFNKGIMNQFFFLKERIKEFNTYLQFFFFFYSQINLILFFIDGNLFKFYLFIKASNGFLFLSLIKTNIKWLIQIC